MVLKLENADYLVLELVMKVQIWSLANHSSPSGASWAEPVSAVYFAVCPLPLALMNPHNPLQMQFMNQKP